MDLTADERELLLAGLFALTVSGSGDHELRDRARALAAKLGGDPEAPAFAIAVLDETAVRGAPPDVGRRTRRGVLPASRATTTSTTTCRTPSWRGSWPTACRGGEHHLAALDHPDEGMVIGCTHCHRFWRDPDPAEE